MSNDVFVMEVGGDDDFEAGGNFLRVEGTYHLVVQSVDPKPISKGSLVPGFRVKFGVLAGTVDGQRGKEVELMFWNPDMSADEKKQQAKRRDQLRFLLAVGLVTRGEKKVQVDLTKAAGRQCVAVLSLYKEYLNLGYGGQIYHVDDPEAQACPKSQKDLDRIPKELRKVSGGGKPQPETAYSQESKPAGAKVDLSAL